jgi:FkbM family methyltransferase
MITQARTLWATGGKLGLNPLDRAKYLLSWGLSSRHPFLSKMAPAHFIVHLPCGIRAAIRPNGVDGKTVSEIFDGRLYDISAVEVKRVLDLGANIGAATMFFASRFPEAEFACVEPSPSNQLVLRESIRLNLIRATVFAGAVGIEAGEADLHLGGDPDMFSLTPAIASEKTIRIRQFTVPDLLTALGWEKIDVLKIDIEGYEKILLNRNNAWLGRVRLIIGEAHGHVDYGIEEVRADLAPFGFNVKLKSYDEKHRLTIFEARNESALTSSV